MRLTADRINGCRYRYIIYLYGGLNAILNWILTLKLFKSIENRSDRGRVDSVKILQTTDT